MLHTSLGRSFQILGESKTKLWPKCLTDLKNDERGLSGVAVRVLASNL